METIIWVSRHVPSPEQYKEMRDFSKKRYNVRFINKTIVDVDEILSEVTEDTIGIMAVLSPELLSKLVEKSKVPVFRAITKRCLTSRGTFEFTHDHFEVVEEFVMKTRRLV